MRFSLMFGIPLWIVLVILAAAGYMWWRKQAA